MKTKNILVIEIFTIVLFILFGCVKKERNVDNEYVLNIRSKKIHIMSCDVARKMSEKNKKVVKEAIVIYLNKNK